MKKMILFLKFVLLIKISTAQSDTVFNQTDANGLRQGYWKIQMTDIKGTTYLYAIESYKNGKKDGMCIYFYPNGQKQSEINYKNDTLNGLAKYYRAYGVLQYEENFFNGVSDGFKRYYNTSGGLTEEQEYTKGYATGVYNLYSKKRNIIVTSYNIEGVENGTRKVYADNNQRELIREFDFRNGVRVAARYYKNGKLVKEDKFNYEDELKKDKELQSKHKGIDG
jgi:antitoxin component YwqK of YwqJK toxin-antitoxin module